MDAWRHSTESCSGEYMPNAFDAAAVFDQIERVYFALQALLTAAHPHRPSHEAERRREAAVGQLGLWPAITRAADQTRFTRGYLAHLRSPQWRALVDRLMLERGPWCEQCQEFSDRLDGHHLTYARLGHENDDDIALLCRSCHDMAHGLELPEAA